MTPSTIQAAARRKYNVVGDTFYNDDFFYDLIYEAEMELARQGLMIDKVYTTTSVASQREYSFPTNAISIRRIEYDGNKLQYSTFREDDGFTLSQADTTQTGTPDYYQIWDKTIYLRPIPSTASLTIKIYTYDQPTLLSAGGSNLAVPTEYHTDIVNFVVSNLAAKNQDTQTAQYYLGLWDRAVQRARRFEARRRRSDKPARVQNVDDLPQTYQGLI